MNLQLLLMGQADEDTATVRSYSGRGMFGRTCLAITGSVSQCQQLLAEALKEGFRDVCQLMSSESLKGGQSALLMAQIEHETDEYDTALGHAFNYAQDQMGLDVVWYWPNIKWVEVDEG